jgi:hypothetical protein
MTTYYKATRPDGTDFKTGTIDYAAALASGEVIRHPRRTIPNEPSTYLSVSVEPADCTGLSWPCRLFRVEPVGKVLGGLAVSSNKRACHALRVVEELPAHMALGPNGEAVTTFIERCRTLTPEQMARLTAAWEAAWNAALAAAREAAREAARGAAWTAAWDAACDAAREAAREAAWEAAWDAAWAAARSAATGAARGAAWDAACDAARAILVRDLITPELYDSLVQPFRDAGLEEWVK